LPRSRSSRARRPSRAVSAPCCQGLEIAATTGKRPALARLVLHVTYECPYRCAYCETYALREHLHANVDDFRELRSEEIKRILSQARDYGVPYAVLSGGEPFHRVDIYEIIHHCGRVQLPVVINTRHTFSPNEVERIAAAQGIVQLWVSIDSEDPGIATELSGRSGWFEDYVAGLRRLAAAGVAIISISVVNKRNVHRLDGLLAFLSELGVAQVMLHEVSLPTCCVADYPRYDLVRGRELLLSEEERAIAREAEARWAGRLQFASRLAEETGEGGTGAIPMLSTAQRDPTALPRICSILNGEMLVRPDGKVVYCGLAQDIVLGDLRCQSLAEVAQSRKLNTMCNPTREAFAGTDCCDCTAFDVCTRLGRCYKRTLWLNGACLAPDPKLCQRFLGKEWQTDQLQDELVGSTG